MNRTDLAPLAMAATEAIRSRARQARGTFDDYVEFVLRDHQNRPLRQAAIHRCWSVHVQWCWANGYHPAILAPFEHGKSVQIVLGWVSYAIGLNQNIRSKIVCNSDDSAKERVIALANILRSRPYRYTFPHIEPVPPSELKKLGLKSQWTQHKILVRRPGSAIDATVHGAGVLSTGIGGRADLIIFDDVVDQKNAIDNPGLRPKVVHNFDRVWMSRLTPEGRVLYIGTPWHMEDLTHQLMDRSAWCVLRQWVADDYSCIHQEVYNAPVSYPLPRLELLRAAG